MIMEMFSRNFFKENGFYTAILSLSKVNVLYILLPTGVHVSLYGFMIGTYMREEYITIQLSIF